MTCSNDDDGVTKTTPTELPFSLVDLLDKKRTRTTIILCIVCFPIGLAYMDYHKL